MKNIHLNCSVSALADCGISAVVASRQHSRGTQGVSFALPLLLTEDT